MRYNEDVEKRILAQIEATPDAEIILPDWAYWKGRDQPIVYIDGRPVRLIRHLYELVIHPLPPEAGVAMDPGVSPRNINPYLATPTPRRRQRLACPAGHPYTERDRQEDGSHRCQVCIEANLKGTPSVAEVNRAKSVCPQGHTLVKRPNGRRRCLECPRDQQRRYLERKRRETA